MLEALAPAGKTELREAGGEILLGGKVRPEWRSSSSSGSTGEPFRVYYDLRAWATLKILVKLRARRACGTARPTAWRCSTPFRPPRSTGARAGRPHQHPPARGHRSPPSLPLSAPHRLRPSLGAARGGRTLRDAGVRLGVRRVFTSGELLRPGGAPGDRRGLRRPGFDVYGSSETKEIAWECPAGGMHVNADVVRLEVLDDANRPSPRGSRATWSRRCW